MATVTFITPGAQSPGTIIQSGQTLQIDGWAYGTVKPEKRVYSAAVDVEQYATLRTELLISSITRTVEIGVQPELYVFIESSPTEVNGPWEPLGEFVMREIHLGQFSARKVFTGFQRWVRASHFYLDTHHVHDFIRSGTTLSFGLTAEAF